MSLNVGATGTLVITMPAGISYVPGSVTGATELSVSGNTVTFDVTTAGTVTYKHTADCSVDETATFTDGAVLNGTGNNISNVYNVAEAAPQTTVVVNAPATVDVGVPVTRTATITNGGIGTATDWYYQDIVSAGTYNFNTTTITFGGNPVPAANVTITSGGGYDTLTVHFTAAEMVLIGNNNQYFDGNSGVGTPEEFDIVYTATPLSCGGGGYALNSSHRVYYGCGGICSDVDFGSTLDINIAEAPQISYSHNSTIPVCPDGVTPIPSTLTITNNGGPATDVNLQFGNYYTDAAPTYGYPSAIDTATFKYSINGGPLQTPVFTNVYTNAGGTWFGSSNCGLENGVGQFNFHIPVIPAGATVTINYNFFVCCSSNPSCPGGNVASYGLYQNDQYILYGTCKNACGDVSYDLPEGYFNSNSISENATFGYPSDMSDGQTATFSTSIVAVFDLPTAAGAYFEINTILPSGYVYNGTPAANITSGIYTWSGTTTQSGNVVTTRFYYPAPPGIQIDNMKYNIDLSLSCALRTGGTATILQNHKFVGDPACSCIRELVCIQGTPLLHCAGPCPEGINNLYSSVLRKNYGLPDADNNGVADAGPYDFSKMATNTAMWGDTIEYIYGGIVGWNPANGAFTNYYAETSITGAAGKVTLVGADVSRYVGGVLVSGPTAYPATLTGNSITTDFSAMGASISIGDSLVTRMRVRFIDPAFIQADPGIVNYKSSNFMYASRSANPLPTDTTIASGRKYCDVWAGTFQAISYYYTIDMNTPTWNGCEGNQIHTYSYLSIGPYGTNNYYEKSLRFPYEVRQWAYAKTSAITLPASAGYTLDSVRIRFHRTAGNTYAYYDALTVPYTLSGDTIKVNLEPYYAEFGGDPANPIGDDGWRCDTYYYVSVNCKTVPTAQPIWAGITSAAYLGHVPSDYAWSQANARNLTANPLQLVAAGGAGKNVSGRTFYYPSVAISNQSNVPSSYGYVSFVTNASTTITEVTYAGNVITADANGYYNIGGFTNYGLKALTVRGTTTSCAIDTFKMYYGWSCKEFPTTPFTVASACAAPLNFILKPLSAKIDGTITPLATTPINPATGGAPYFASPKINMCEPFPVEITVNSALQGTIFEVKTNVKLPAGITYVPGSAYFETPVGTAPVAVSAAQEALLAAAPAGGTLPFDLSLMSTNTINELKGTIANPPTVRQLKIRFQAQTGCTYNGKGRIRATLLAKRACGTNALNNGTIKSGNSIKFTAPASSFIINMFPTLGALKGCGSSTPGSITIDKQDANIPTSTDSMTLTVPSSVDISNITCLACSPALGTPDVVDDGTTKTLSWQYPANNITGVIVVNFDASANSTATCSNTQEISTAFTQQKQLQCNGVDCSTLTAIETGSGNANFTVNLPEYNISALTAEVFSTQSPYVYNTNATITNTSTVSSPGYTLVYAYDVDGDGLITATDVIIETVTTNTALAAGASITTANEILTTIPSNGADLIVAVLASNNPLNASNTTCACGDAYATVPITQGATASLGNKVWNDLDKDGVQDAGEVGVAGITVTLYDDAGVPVASTVTYAYGNYLFSNLAPGDYSVGFTLPANYVFSPSTGTSETDAVNSDVNPLTGLTTNVTLSAGENQLNIDAGINYASPTTASVGNFVWSDTDGDGVQDAGEPGISGVTVTLYDALGNPVATTVTDANGFYQFANVTPGTYTVGFTPPVGMVFSPNVGGVNDPSNSDVNAGTGQTASFVVNAGDNITYVDAGFVPQNPANASLGDKVWNDLNMDGIQDAGEPGVAGVTVTLYAADGVTVVATTVTDAFGNYIFNNLTPADYVVGFSSLPTDYAFSTAGAGSDTTKNSDANTVSGKTGVISLLSGDNNMTIDAGIHNTNPLNTNSIGDKVWNDLDKDGVQDAGEPGVAGVTVTLYNAAGTPIGTTTTDANGNYLFPNLPNGTYSVGFSNFPANMVLTNSGQGTPGTDSDPDKSTGKTGPLVLSGGTNLTAVDAGLITGDTRIGTASLGDVVWYDLDGDGLQDAGENGVSGVTVTLYAADGVTVIGTTVTDALGNYIFTNLPAGTYKVGFSNLPAGFTVSPENADGQSINGENNSDVNSGTLQTPAIVLGNGEDKMSVDMGIVPPAGTASLGNKVWNDLDNDGNQDAGEIGMAGVTVTLYDATGNIVSSTTTDANGEYSFVGLTPGDYSVGFTNLPAGFSFSPVDADATGINGANNSDVNPLTGRTTTVSLTAGQNNPNVDAGIHSATTASLGDFVWNDINGDGLQSPGEPGIGGVLVTLYDASGNPVASTLTNADGSYNFPNVTPGTYTVGFSNLPSGMVFTTQEGNPGSNTGSNVNPGTGQSAPFTLAAGTYNNTIDAGLTTPVPTGGLGNFVWFDVNSNGIQDAGEQGVPGVTVTLYAADGTTVLGTAITDGNGAYSFTNLPAGNYIVGFNDLPATYGFTPIVDADPTTGSDVITSAGKTGIVVVRGGAYNPNIDAGIVSSFALAIKLVTFDAIRVLNDGQLTWVSESELNADRYDVYRSIDNVTYEKLGMVKAKGTTNSSTTYNYTDKNITSLQTSVVYYKLHMIDNDGKMEKSDIRSINLLSISTGNLYPNPMTDVLNIELGTEMDVQEATIKMFDMSGKVVRNITSQLQRGTNVITIDVRDLAAAQYQVVIYKDGAQVSTQKITKRSN
jgi:hypothetical protein